jgi:hypothetical protein
MEDISKYAERKPRHLHREDAVVFLSYEDPVPINPPMLPNPIAVVLFHDAQRRVPTFQMALLLN